MNALQATISKRRVRINYSATQTNVGENCVVTQAVLIRLRSSPYHVLRSLTCEFQSGQLFLEGHVPTYYMKQMAQEAIRTVHGVEVIVNQVTVQKYD